MERYIEYKLRQIIKEGIANILMSKTLEDGKINLMMTSTLYGAPYSTKPYVLKKYADKKEESFKIDLRELFNDNLILYRDKKSSEVIGYTKDNYKGNNISGSKQIFTINMSSDRLKPSFVRFDFLPNKEKIKIPITISKEEIETIILNKKQEIINSGFDNIFI